MPNFVIKINSGVIIVNLNIDLVECYQTHLLIGCTSMFECIKVNLWLTAPKGATPAK